MRCLLLLALLPVVGCVTPCHQACELAKAPEPACEADMATRGHVQVFILNGSDPFVSLKPLRTRLNEAGFAKVSVGGLFYTGTFETEIRKLHTDDANTRFVLIGYGLGVASADSLATKLAGEGILVDAVVAMAPRTLPGWDAVPNEGIKRLVIRTKASPLEITDQHAYSIPDARSIASDDAAGELVVQAVRESCAAVPGTVEMVTVLPILDDPAPMPRAPQKQVKGILTNTVK